MGPDVAQQFSNELKSLQDALADGRRELADAVAQSNLERFNQASELPGRLTKQFQRLTTMLGPSTVVLSPLARSDDLKTGLGLFLGGKYQDTVAALPDDMVLDMGDVAKQHFYTFRAAAHYALYIRSGETDKDRLGLAIADVKSCKALKSDFQPPADTFSPRFRDFFAKTQ